MNWTIRVLGVAAVALIAVIAFGLLGGVGWGPHDQVTHIVPGSNGETLVITDGGNRGWFPFSPLFVSIPIFWLLMIGGLIAWFGRHRWNGGPGFGPSVQSREHWLDDWHRAQHSDTAGAAGAEITPTPGSPTPSDERPA